MITYLEPRKIAGLGRRYIRHPGPYAIGEEDLKLIFPGIMDDGEIRLEGIGSGEHVKGDADPPNLSLLCRIAAHTKPKTVLEVGTFRGKTTYNLAINTPQNTQIITIDLPREEFIGLETFYGTDIEYFQPREIIGAFWKGKPEAAKIKQIYADSTSMKCQKSLDEILQGERIDLAFIDAGHDYESTKQNYQRLVLPRMNIGGVIVLDNYGGTNIFTHVGIADFVTEDARSGSVFYYYAPSGELKHKATSCLIQLWIPDCWNHEWKREVVMKQESAK